MLCESSACGVRYPIRDGVPVLFRPDNPVFSADAVSSYQQLSRARSRLGRFAPRLTGNFPARRNFARLADLLCEMAERPRLLVIGGQVLGRGMSHLAENPHLVIVESDVASGPRPHLLSDAHDIPFADGPVMIRFRLRAATLFAFEIREAGG